MLLMLTDMRNFDTWLAGFRPSIADYKYYVDFDKVFNNVEAIKIPLNILNLLLPIINITLISIRFSIMWRQLKFHSIS